MLDIFAQFATDETLENNGTWVDYSGARFLVARINNRKYVKTLTSAVEKNQKALDLKNDESNDLSDKIMIDTFATTILLGWEEVAFKGEEIPYSEANARLLLGVKDFRKEIAKMAENMDAYRVKVEAEQEKN